MTKGDVSLLSCIGPLREDPALVILSPPLGGCWGAVPMPRGARKQSESSIYHVMVRGVNQMQLFYDDEDRIVFVERIRRYRDECGFKLYAWCLMDNHVHLLIEVGNVELATIMKKLLLSYSHWFNNKYDRSGYLYEGRFVSKAVDDDHYLLGAVRYIHRNPLEVGGSVDTWTSYRDYMGSDGPGITDTGLVLGMLAEDPERARLAFHELVTGEAEPCDYDFGKPRGQIQEEQAASLIKEIAGVENCTDVCALDSVRRSAAIAEMRSKGLSIRRISRLTGLSRGVVERAGYM